MSIYEAIGIGYCVFAVGLMTALVVYFVAVGIHGFLKRAKVAEKLSSAEIERLARQ